MPLNDEERIVVERVKQYFHSDHMSLYEKLFHASLIAQLDLEAQNFGSYSEKMRIIKFQRILNQISEKLSPQSSPPDA